MKMSQELVDKIKKYDKFKIFNRTIAIFLYGSNATGNFDENSDIDIVVLKEKYECDDEGLIQILSEFYDETKMDISFYRKQKFENLLKCGSLFCHHLKNEAELIYSRNGKPKSYYFNKLKEFKGLSEDILVYNRIFKRTKESFFESGVNYFDLGILGQISRNTLIILNYKKNPKTCKFGKFEVYKAIDNKNINFDISIYKELLNYRSFYKRRTPIMELPDCDKLKSILNAVESLLAFSIKEIGVEHTIDRIKYILEDDYQRNFYTTFEIFTDLDRDMYFDLKYYLKKVDNYDLSCSIFYEFKKDHESDEFLSVASELYKHIIRIKKFSTNYDIELPRIEEVKNYSRKISSIIPSKIPSKILRFMGWLDCVADDLDSEFKEVIEKYIYLRNKIYQEK